MESRWRRNVANLIGTNYAEWHSEGGGDPFLIVKLCGELVTPIHRFGQWWTHLLAARDFGTPWQAYLARLTEDSNILDRVILYGFFPGNFPWGVPVVPDHP